VIQDEEGKLPEGLIPAKPVKKKCCTCKNSQCLKLYCECLKHGETCGPECSCVNCKNIEGNEERKVAIAAL
jgi:hypothetical protein